MAERPHMKLEQNRPFDSEFFPDKIGAGRTIINDVRNEVVFSQGDTANGAFVSTLCMRAAIHCSVFAKLTWESGAP
jgi:hypothetical protein